MKVSTLISLLACGTHIYAQHGQQFLSTAELESDSVTCQNGEFAIFLRFMKREKEDVMLTPMDVPGVKPSITCTDPTPDTSNTACSCTCSNGLIFTQPIPRPGSSSNENNALLAACEAAKFQCLSDERNSAQRQLILQNELSSSKQQCIDDTRAGMQREADLNQQLAAWKRESLYKEHEHTRLETELREQLAEAKKTCLDESLNHNQRETELKDQITGLKAQHLSETQSLESRITSLTTQLSTCQNNAAPKPKVYTYAGCYVDSEQRILNRKSAVNNGMTNKICEAICTGYKYYATQNSNYCSCGNEFSRPTQQVADAQCNMGCVGNSGEKCWGALRNSVYELKD
jgi:hypothetical protein